MNTLTLKNLVVYIEKEKFTPQNYERQMAYLQENTPFFQKVVFLEPENAAGLFDLSDMADDFAGYGKADAGVGDRCAWISGRGR